MPRVFIHFTFLFFAITALSGLWMRGSVFFHTSILPYTNVLHGHSHLAILGWAFIGAFVVFLTIFWKTITQKKQAITITLALCVTSVFMFIAFLYQGYGVISIIMSTLHIFIEYWASAFIYRQLKIHSHIPKSAKAFMNGALLVLILSSIGPYALGFIAANGLKDTDFFDMAMYFYLHFQYNGWLTLFLIGLFISIVHLKKVIMNSFLLIIGFWLYFISLFPGYFLSVLWVDLGELPYILALIGGIGQWLGVLAILMAIKNSWNLLVLKFTALTISCLRITLILLLIKSTMELGLISPALANLIYDTRSIVIGYLHLTLLGFVSIFILTLYQLAGIIKNDAMALNGFIVFFIGFLLNEIFLFIQGFTQWLNLFRIPFYTQALLLASCFLLIGVMIQWLAFARNKRIFY
ncbi:hypothetical protein [Bacillus sp. Marseille-P3661]|uniref:hypothetical protein n=1 Tax=Bacillus sp. Marseille-P3661 TaxID=1936234 RepID=UPI000C860083|nr:hypothetical protein [Bacillus sp. Marseille-P3661]